ncbi:lipase 3-like [Ctenocephalides felis]|uniref:lipase 3-like n=1 Tax=Ctenocephalides felis TaxID=7515 RepID=UPI000E6E48E5|nr:lipase 3-like [Ctenocephalides felis]
MASKMQDYIENIINTFPGGASAKQFNHFAQVVNAKRFRKFDYGATENLNKYGTVTPPDYYWQNITVKSYVYYGQNDILTVPEDVKGTAGNLINLIEIYKVPDSKFTHTDFLWARNAERLIYTKIIQDLQSNQ